MEFFLLPMLIVAVLSGCMMNENAQESGRLEVPSVLSPPYFEMSVAETESFREGVGRIQIGDTSETVIRVLGRPTYDQTVAGKEPSASIRGRSLKYYVRRYERGLVNEKQDRLVSIFVDLSNRVVRITSNCDGIPSRP